MARSGPRRISSATRPRIVKKALVTPVTRPSAGVHGRSRLVGRRKKAERREPVSMMTSQRTPSIVASARVCAGRTGDGGRRWVRAWRKEAVTTGCRPLWKTLGPRRAGGGHGMECPLGAGGWASEEGCGLLPGALRGAGAIRGGLGRRVVSQGYSWRGGISCALGR
ncbi:hypothetical protein ACSSS7_008442 [Eimeria intestinalis]